MLQTGQLHAVSSVVSSAGITGSQQAMFFAEVKALWSDSVCTIRMLYSNMPCVSTD